MMLFSEERSINRAARSLGWASLGIGLTELAAPQVIEEMLGLESKPTHQGILRVLGVRELLHGLSLLTEDRTTEQLKVGIWSRVAGDLLDNALLGIAATKTQRPLSFATVAAGVAGIGMLDMFFAVKSLRH